MGRIRVLPDELVNQIAAGEVIERPASVVKELIENALDAGARSIAVDVEGGGRRRIRVADDGEGLDKDDALLALERHATSKLRAAADLGRIVTLGFRGEALPAIASVSRLTLTTSRDGRGGARVEIEGGRILRVEDAGHPRGTTMDVRDLFFNTPARAKFLKSPPTELGHISDLAASCSVTSPAVGLWLRHEGRALIEAVAADDETSRIRQVFGEEWSEAIPFARRHGALAVRGLIAPPRAQATARRTQHLYVNGRLVRDRLAGHAVMAAFQAFLPKDRHPAIFVFITCPPEAVDVNVHPAKAEVRFADPRALHDLLQTAILEALREAMPVAALGAAGAAAPMIAPGRFPAHEAVERYLAAADGADASAGPRFAAAEPLPGIPSGPVALAHYLESYIVAADGQGLLIVDQHAAHERILYERILDRVGDKGGERQKLMFPFTAPLPRALVPKQDEVMAELEQLGLASEPFGGGTLAVTETPLALPAGGLPALMADLFQQMLDEGLSGQAQLTRREKLLATIACHAAIKVRMPLSHEKMNYLINELFRTRAPLKCPHGRPAVQRFSREQIEKGFDRRGAAP